ncbi:MAG: hypothetical protein MUD13_00060 [Candidatus Nanopelagicales bacterium]|jgi:hypothetical protein|nr:hypothetical protein [Candidatus Nanopelagicales bacterium]
MSRPAIAAALGAVLAGLWGYAVVLAADLGVWAILVFLGVTIAVGTVVAARVPGNPIGWMLLAVAAFFLVQAPIEALGERLLDTHPALASWLLWFGADRDDTWTWYPPLWFLFTQVLLHFPDGRLPSPRWRPFRLGTWVVGVVGTVTLAVIRSDVVPGVASPAGLISNEHVLVLLALLGLVVCALGSAASLVVRYRHASGVVREQITWVTFAVVLVISVYAISLTAGVVVARAELPWLWSLVSLWYSLIPISMGIAILRYRLWEIDRILSRTVAYALVTALVLGVYALTVTTVARLLPSSSTLAVALATLTAAAAFRPLLARVQGRVDRRFDRARFDGLREVEAFAERLAGAVDPDAVTADLRSVLDRTLAPSRVGVWTAPGRTIGSTGSSART